MNYEEALRYLDSLTNYEAKDKYDYNQSFTLDRMRRLASFLADPQKNFKSIHIAGTKGKGSTSAITYSILKSAGYKTGLYTSPHLVSFRERIRIDDQLIGEDDIARLLTKIRDAASGMKEDAPTFFETCTAIAYLYFSEKRVDFAVFEVGLGGRLDATNIIEPLVEAITPISYEHTDKLGNTLTSIAGEKGGIIKDDSFCVIAPQEKEALDAIIKICSDRKAKPVIVGKDIKFKELELGDSKEYFVVSGLSGDYLELEMSLLGSHQIANCATAIGIMEALRFHDINISADAIRKGVKNAKWPGRLETVSKNPRIVLDGAQNRASANALKKSVNRNFKYKKLILVLGVSKDKDIKGILEELTPIADKVILTKSKIKSRAAEPSMIKELIPSSAKSVYMTDTVDGAMEKAKSFAGVDDLILVTGSLFVVGEAKHG
jgi:dihydrofolate synthase/folylpolyglutamate synthase